MSSRTQKETITNMRIKLTDASGVNQTIDTKLNNTIARYLGHAQGFLLELNDGTIEIGDGTLEKGEQHIKLEPGDAIAYISWWFMDGGDKFTCPDFGNWEDTTETN